MKYLFIIYLVISSYLHCTATTTYYNYCTILSSEYIMCVTSIKRIENICISRTTIVLLLLLLLLLFLLIDERYKVIDY